jgi:hypothetical protein
MPLDKKILSIDADDDGVDIKSFTKFSVDHTEREKNKIAKEFEEIGQDLLDEIEIKKAKQEILKCKYIIYIAKHDKYTVYPKIETYSFVDVKKIYDELRSKDSMLKKIFRFIFNL